MVGEREIYKRNGTCLRKRSGEKMEKFGTPDSSEKTIAIVLGDRWSLTAKQEGDKMRKKYYIFYVICGEKVLQ